MPPAHIEGKEQHGHPYRPYLVVSVGRVARLGLIVACPVTKSAPRDRDFHIPFTAEQVKASGGGPPLQLGGTILVNHLRSLDYRDRSRSTRGRADAMLMAEVDLAMRELLGLD